MARLAAPGDTDDYCDSPSWTVSQTFRIPPQAAACTGCHGPGSWKDVESVHAR